MVTATSANKQKPDWAGGDMLSRLVNLLIHTKPLYWLMKQQARRVLIGTAEKNGIPWRQSCRELEQSGVQETLAAIANPNIAYPAYYTVPFHAYTAGNLCWQAAFEAAPATYAMALRVWPQESLTWQVAQARLRGSFHEVLATYGPKDVRHILDMGCSVGLSTQTLHQYYIQRQTNPVYTVGLDLSPQMLAVANVLDQAGDIAQWVHGNAEATDFADASFDLVTLQFVTHELPHYASQAIFQEVQRILRPGGCLAIVDNNPKSPVIQRLPPALFVLMKSTEPWSDDYYTFDMESALQAAGLEHRITVASDPRHRTLIAIKPS